MDAYLPEDYVPDPRQKMELYKRLAAVEEEPALRDLATEVEDRFGRPAPQVESLFEAVRIRIWARKLGLSEVTQKGGQVVLRFYADRAPAGGFAARILAAYPGRVRF